MKTLTKLQTLVAVGALAGMGAAHATDLIFTDGTPLVAPETRAFGNSYNLVGGQEVDTHGNTAAAGTGAFTDVYDFAISLGSYLGSAVMSTEWAPNVINISGLHEAIFDSSNNLLFDGTTDTTSGLTTFTTVGGSSASDFAAAGSYKLEVTGNIVGTQGGSYGGTFTAAPVAAIPEPEIYGMLAAGLGIMGFVARRRKSIGA